MQKFIKPDLQAFDRLETFMIRTELSYRKFPKYSDTQKFAVITLKVEQNGVSLE